MSLIVHIQDLKEHPVTLEINHPPEFFELEDKEFTFKDRVVGNVTFTLVQRNILASGWLETKAYKYWFPFTLKLASRILMIPDGWSTRLKSTLWRKSLIILMARLSNPKMSFANLLCWSCLFYHCANLTVKGYAHNVA